MKSLGRKILRVFIFCFVSLVFCGLTINTKRNNLHLVLSRYNSNSISYIPENLNIYLHNSSPDCTVFSNFQRPTDLISKPDNKFIFNYIAKTHHITTNFFLFNPNNPFSFYYSFLLAIGLFIFLLIYSILTRTIRFQNPILILLPIFAFSSKKMVQTAQNSTSSLSIFLFRWLASGNLILVLNSLKPRSL
jgi:hypothetical protein